MGLIQAQGQAMRAGVSGAKIDAIIKNKSMPLCAKTARLTLLAATAMVRAGQSAPDVDEDEDEDELAGDDDDQDDDDDDDDDAEDEDVAAAPPKKKVAAKKKKKSAPAKHPALSVKAQARLQRDVDRLLGRSSSKSTERRNERLTDEQRKCMAIAGIEATTFADVRRAHAKAHRAKFAAVRSPIDEGLTDEERIASILGLDGLSAKEWKVVARAHVQKATESHAEQPRPIDFWKAPR